MGLMARASSGVIHAGVFHRSISNTNIVCSSLQCMLKCS